MYNDMLGEIFVERGTNGEVIVDKVYEEDGEIMVQIIFKYSKNVGMIMTMKSFLEDFELKF